MADKKLDVKESSDKFIKGMMGILRTTVYGSLANVDLVIFLHKMSTYVKMTHNSKNYLTVIKADNNLCVYFFYDRCFSP